MVEPEILSRGKAFHKKVQEDWKDTAKDGGINIEHTIKLSLIPKNSKRKRYGRMDIFVDDLGGFVSVVEIKSTDWDGIKNKNIKRLLGAHRRQVWQYIEKYIDKNKMDVCPGIIYPKSPKRTGLKELVEDYLNDYGLQVVWYYD